MVSNGVKRHIEIGGSGFETTFAALAIRNALATISTMASGSCLTLDEPDSTVNDENLDVLYELYNRILKNYDFIFHTTHTMNVEDRHDMIGTVVKEGNISKIEI